MTRQALVLIPRTLPRAPRADRRRDRRSPIRPTPEMFAGLAILALASAGVIGFFGVLFFFASAGLVIAMEPLSSGRHLLRFSPLLLIPLLAVISTIWSGAPQLTMRISLELLLTFIAAIVICRNLEPARLILLLFLAYFGMSLLTTPYVPTSLAAGTPLVAGFGSKNQVGLIGYMLFALSLAVACDRRQPRSARAAVIGAAPLALLLVYLSQSGGTTSSVAIVLLVFPPLAALVVIRPPLRLALVLLTLGMLAAAGFFLDDIEAAVTEFRQNVLKKDVTLTGRTYLWDFANRLSAERPMLGHGYASFWRQGNLDAEGLWRWGGVPNKSGFNFHNAFVGTRVDLGLVGMSLLILTCAGIAAVALVRQIARPSMAMACLIGITTVNYFRSLVEEGLAAPFSLLTLIWLATGIYAFEREGPTRSAAAGRTGPRRNDDLAPRRSVPARSTS